MSNMDPKPHHREMRQPPSLMGIPTLNGLVVLGLLSQ